MTEDDEAVEAAARILRRRAGLFFDAPGRRRLADALDEQAQRHAIPAVAVVARLDQDAELLQEVLDGVTLQETSFFRDEQVFDAIAHEVLPRIDGPVTAWSAGCADGHEAYSLAMLLEESGRQTWSVLGTDLSRGALARARAGVFAERRLRGLSAARRARHLRQTDEGWEVRGELRAHVRFEAHNLATDPLPTLARTADVVLCRNVLIYVDRDAVRRFLQRLHEALRPGAVVVVGTAESLWQFSDRFAMEPFGAGFAYRRTDGSRPPRTRPATHRAPAGRRRPPPSPADVEDPPAAGPTPDAAQLLAEGERAMAADRLQEAAEAFRKATYVAPDAVLAHVQLGLVLERSGDAGALRAFRAARSALERADAAVVQDALGGYHPEELARLLAAKLGEHA